MLFYRTGRKVSGEVDQERTLDAMRKAALDPISECEVYESFDRLVGHKAAVYISHRLASCRFCDRILVFAEGGIVQNGSHKTLVEQEGLYREMWNAQAQWYADTAEKRETVQSKTPC